ncbi:MAG: TonB-dependent receptor [Acidobacteriota bacterium]|nr:TonB-dependent receptor [Acidobacteriota bacterium]
MAALYIPLFCLALHAQYDNGTLLGTIRDSTGAPIPYASVVVTNTATSVTAESMTNGSGDYEVPSVRVGVYSIKAHATGFSDTIADDITVSVGERQRINFTLKVGSAQTTIEVSGVALQVESETSQRDQIITSYQSAAFPLVTRNYSDLLALIPGSRQAPTSVFTSSSNSLVRAGSFNVNGQRSMFNNFLLDGLDNNAYGESNQGFDNQIIAVPPDSVAQFQVVTNNESAEYGRASGATINVASQSGTNKLHATLYEFFRNTRLNAPGFFKPTLVGGSGISVPFQKPTFNRNQYGFNIGGPVLRNKLFFFVDYEGFRQVLRTLSVLTLPTQNELNGIFVVPVRNPVTGAIYSANTPLPAGAINPLSAQIAGYFKQIGSLPISGLAATGVAQNDYNVLVPFHDNADKGDVRVDWQIASTRSAFLRVSDRKENAINSASIPIPLDGQTNGHIRVLDQQIALGFTQIFGLSKVLDARLGLDRTKAGKYNLSIGNTAFSTPGTSSYIPGLPSNPAVAGGLPSINISNFSGFGRQGTNPQWQNPALLDPKLNLTWVKGDHSLKFGYEYERVWMAVNDNNPLYGSFTFGGGYSLCNANVLTNSSVNCPKNASSQPYTSVVADNYFADFLFGTSSAYQLANYFVAHLTRNMHFAYAQDDWKATPNLTLNLGLRWEYASPYGELYKQVSNFDPDTQTVLTTSPGAVAGNGITPVSAGGVYGMSLVNPDFKDFGPRVGFSYSINPRTVARGGFGIAYSHYTRAGSGDILGINAPQAQFASVVQPAPTTSNHCSTPLPAQIIPIGSTAPSCYATADQGYPSGLVTSFNPATDNITYIPKNSKDSYVESYFVSVQRQLARNSLLDIAYVGNHGLHLEGFLSANQKDPSKGFARPFANWPSDITAAVNEFYSNFNSLQVKYEQRMLGGLTLLNSFTWEHALDNASASLEGNTPSPQNAYNLSADYAQSDYNLPIANSTSLVYELPFGRGRRFLNSPNWIAQTLVGGWQVSAINSAQSGTPFNLTYNPNSAQQLSPQISATYRGANEYRPNRVPGQKVTQGTGSRASNTGFVNYVNLAAFTLPPNAKDANGTPTSPFGNASRNPGRSPAFNETDLSLNKRFTTPVEGVDVAFRTEFYNIFNHTNFYLPGNISGTQGAGASGGGQITSTFEPRILQFGLKILY